MSAQAQKEFAHLHLHTDFSLLDGAIQIKKLGKRAAELGMKSVAITDHGNLFGAISFYNQMKGSGVKPIIGIEAYIARGSRHSRGGDAGSDGEKGTNHIILLAKNLTGYHNLVKLTSKSFTEGFYYKPRIDKELLAQHSEGLIGLSACMSGVTAAYLSVEKFDKAAESAMTFQDMLGKGNYFLEIQDHELEMQRKIHKPLVELSKKTGIPLVATNDCHYLMPEDYKAHDVLLCVGTGKNYSNPNRLRYGSDKFYFRSAQEMWEVFGELPETLYRTMDIAEMCNLEFPKTVNHLPMYPVPDGYTVDSYFEKVANDGLAARWKKLQDKASRKHSYEEYKQRLDHEIAVIKQMGFPGYFLIVWDFIKYAKEQGIPVGPGRGSAAGSLVAYSMLITDVDPLEYDLLFERFLNPDRVSMPDIDIDFCVRGRGKVIDYVSEFYGRESVSQIITFGTMASKAAIKDVGRSLEMPYAEVEKIAKMIPPPVRGRNCSIEQAIEQVPELKKAIAENPDVAELITIARKLEGCARHASVHAAGVVISPKPLDELVPVYKSNKDELTTQYSMNDLEKTGMLKMDFLALTTLTIIDDALKTIQKERGETLDINDIPLTDEKTMRLFAEGRCDGIFQFESGGMVEICRKLKPEGIEDLAALNALYRPGPLDSGMIDEFIERRHGKRKVKYDFPELKEVLGNTLGVIVYQEQIMAMFQRLGDYTLGQADMVRRAMGKKKREELDKHKETFLTAAMAKGHDRGKLEKLWTSIEGFADYAFNRSHSVAYAWVAYQTAYLKAHYPTHFWAAVMSNEIDNTAKIAKYITETKGMGIEILSPDVNVSDYNFTPAGEAIRFGLGAIKGIGQSAVSSIIAAREAGGLFKSIFEFSERVDSKAVNKRVLESLIKSGAFDGFGARRSQLFLSIDKAIEGGARAQRDRESGQVGLFGMFEAEMSSNEDTSLPSAEEWTLEQLLAAEKETLGFYISGHPLEKFSQALKDFCDCDIPSLAEKAGGSQVSVGGTITSVQKKTTKKGDAFALLQVEDIAGSVKIVVWPETYKRTSSLLQGDTPVVVRGKLEVEDEGVYSIIADDIFGLDGIYEKMARGITISANASDLKTEMADRLFELLDKHRGNAEVLLKVALEDKTVVTIEPNQHVTVRLSSELSAAIKKLDPIFNVELILPKTASFKRSNGSSNGSDRSSRVPRVSADDTRTWWEAN